MPRKCLECGGNEAHFSYPQDEQTLYVWLEALGSGNVPRPKKDRICPRHFNATDYFRGPRGNYYLQPGAIPKKVRIKIVLKLRFLSTGWLLGNIEKLKFGPIK